jgi:NB-ARC domain/Trypsin-like peptidase domain
MSTADKRVPGFLGRVLTGAGAPVGTCFQVAPTVLVTAWHVLSDLGAGESGAAVSLDALSGGEAVAGEVVRVDPEHDLAVVRANLPLPSSVSGVAATDSVPPATGVLVTGVSMVEDPAHEYRYLDATGSWGGGTVRDDKVPLGRLETRALSRGMSGAPVRRLADDIVVGVVSARYNSADGWLRDSVWVVRTEDLAPLLAGITDVALAAGVPGRLSSHVPDLPRNFVSRANDVAALVGTVLSQSEPVVVHGMPGIGKTVLASAVAHDEQVRRSFPDGVFWVTFGREHNIMRSQALLAEDLGDGPRAFVDAEQGKARLKTLLAARACLVVLDDVWNAEDLSAFDALGPNCRMMITTRDARVGVPLAGVDYQVNILQEDLALQLLTKWSGQYTDLARAQEVVRACGGLPLALAMIGAMVRGRGDRWDNVLARLRAADLGSIQQQLLGYPFDSLLKALQVSVDALPDTRIATRYLDLALFPEDVAVPETVLLTLWQADGLPVYRAQDDIDLLVERSLVQRDADGLLSLHDLLFDYVRVVRAEAGDVQARHRQLLAAYRAQCQQDWPSGPNDGYFFEYLSRHLVAAGYADELHRLLGLTGADGRHAWYEAKRSLGELAGFLSDVNTAWQLAEQAYDVADDDRAAETVALQIRYALITASLNSLAENIPPALLCALLVHGERGARELLTYAARVPGPEQRSATLAALAPHLPEELLDEALATANAIPDEAVRADAIGRLAARLVELDRVKDGLAAVANLADPALQALALAEMARHRPDLATEAIRITGQLRARQQANVLSQVAVRLADCGLSGLAVDAAQQISDAETRWSALGRLAPHLPPSLADAAIERASTLQPPAKRIRQLLHLLPLLPKSQVQEVLEGVAALRDKAEEAAAYVEVAARLPEPQATSTLDRALQRALQVDNPPRRAHAVATVAAYLPEPLVRRGLSRVKRRPEDQAPAIAALAARLADLGHVEEALDLSQSISNGDQRAEFLDAIAPHLPATVLARALTQTGVIGDAARRNQAMVRLLPHLSMPRHLQQVAEAVGAKRSTQDWVARAVAVARRLSGADRAVLLEQAWQAAGTVADARERIFAFAEIAPHRPHEILEALANDIDHGNWSWTGLLLVEQFAGLLGALADAGHASEAVAAVRSMRLHKSRWRNGAGEDSSYILETVFPGDPSDPHYLDSLRAEEEVEKRSNALFKVLLSGHLLSHVSTDVSEDLATETLGYLDSNWDGSIFIVDLGDLEDMALAAVVRNLPAGLLDRASDLHAARERCRSVPLPETALVLAVRNEGYERNADVDRALDGVFGTESRREVRAGRNVGHEIRESSSIGSITVFLDGRRGYDPMTALPRIVRHLPLYAIDHLLDLRAQGGSALRVRRSDWVWPLPGWRADDAALSALAIRLAELGDLLRALDFACAVRDPLLRYRALDGVAATLAILTRDSLADILAGRPDGSLFRELSNQARDDLLGDLAALSPAAVALGGEAAAVGILDALVDVGRWWP